MLKHLWTNRAWVWVSLGLFVLIIALLLIGKPFQNNGDHAVVAKVNGVEISKDQLYDLMAANVGPDALNSLIQEELLRQEVDKAGVSVSQEEIEAEIAKIKESVGGDEAFENALAMYGMTMEDLEAQTKTQLQIEKIVEPQLSITEEDIRAYYDENTELLSEREKVRASHILVETKEEAEAVLDELKAGTDFAELAKTKSTDTTTAEGGGDLNYFAAGDMEAAFEEAAFAMEIGEISEGIETSYGFHIIKVTGKKDAYTPTLVEKRTEIEDMLRSEQIVELSTAWMEEIQAAAEIENLL